MFGFQIHRRRHSVTKALLGWEVFLPHSCDHWEIADESTLSRDEATSNLRSFIDEAQATLNILEAMPDDWLGHYGPDVDMRFELEDSTCGLS